MQTRNRGAHGQPNTAVRSARKRRFLVPLLIAFGRSTNERELDARLSSRDTRDSVALVTASVTALAELRAATTLAFGSRSVLGIPDSRARAIADLGNQDVWQADLLDDRANDCFRVLGTNNYEVIFITLQRVGILLPEYDVAETVRVNGGFILLRLERHDEVLVPIEFLAHGRPHLAGVLERSFSFGYAESAAAQVPKKAGASRFALGGRFLLSGGSGSGMTTPNS